MYRCNDRKKQSYLQNSNELVDFKSFSKSTLEICNKSLVVMEGKIQKTCEVCDKQFASKYGVTFW